jgi:hypothetical protein
MAVRQGGARMETRREVTGIEGEEGGMDGGGVLNVIPKEMLISICLCLPNRSIVSLQCTSRFFHNLLLDDYFWKLKTLAQFPSAFKKVNSERVTESWKERYKSLILWHWDGSLCRCQDVKVFGKNKRKVENQSRDFEGAFGNFILSQGVHYWEITILDLKSTHRSVGIGVATTALGDEKSFFKSNWGIGYYNDGCIYDLGDSVTGPFPTFAKGDKVGVRVDFENNTLHYYVNGQQLPPDIHLKLSSKSVEVRPAVLFHNSRVKIRYFGSTVPE